MKDTENRIGLFEEIFQLDKPWKRRATIIHLVGLPLFLTMGHCSLSGPVGLALLPFTRWIGGYFLALLIVMFAYWAIAHFTYFGWRMPIKGLRQLNAWWHATWQGVCARAKERWQETREKGNALISPAEAAVVFFLGIPLAIGNIAFLFWLFNEALGGVKYGGRTWVFPITIALVITFAELFLGYQKRAHREMTIAEGRARIAWMPIALLSLFSLFEAGLAYWRGRIFQQSGIYGAEISLLNTVFIGLGLVMPWINAWTGARFPYLGIYLSAVGGFAVVQIVKLIGLSIVWAIGSLLLLACFPILILFAPPTLIYFAIEALIRLLFCGQDDGGDNLPSEATAGRGNGGASRRVYPKVLIFLLLMGCGLGACEQKSAYSREHGQLPECVRRLDEPYRHLSVTEVVEAEERWWHCAVDVSGSNREFWQEQIRACVKAAEGVSGNVGVGIWIVNDCSDTSRTPDLIPDPPLPHKHCKMPELPRGKNFAGAHMLEQHCRLQIQTALQEQLDTCQALQGRGDTAYLRARREKVQAWGAHVMSLPPAKWTSYFRFWRKLEDFTRSGGTHRLVLAGDLEEDAMPGDKQIGVETLRSIGRRELMPPQTLFRLSGLKVLALQTLRGTHDERDIAVGWERILRASGAETETTRYQQGMRFPAWEDPRWNASRTATPR